MKMTIIKLNYKHIRKISSLELSFVDRNGDIIQNNFIMMANGTGKTTTISLIKGLLDGSAANWSEEQVRSFSPTTCKSDIGEFSMSVKFDEKQYKYFLVLDYVSGMAKIETLAPPKGRDPGLRLPESIKGIFTSEFVSRFVFDGEQAKKSMDRTSNEADETIRYLYRLDELDEILAMNESILKEIQNEGGNKGTDGSLNNLRSRQDKISGYIKTLKAKQKKLNDDINAFVSDKADKEHQRKEIDKNYDTLNAEKQSVIADQEKNRSNINSQISTIVELVKLPYLVNKTLFQRMYNLGVGMTKL